MFWRPRPGFARLYHSPVGGNPERNVCGQPRTQTGDRGLSLTISPGEVTQPVVACYAGTRELASPSFFRYVKQHRSFTAGTRISSSMSHGWYLQTYWTILTLGLRPTKSTTCAFGGASPKRWQKLTGWHGQAVACPCKRLSRANKFARATRIGTHPPLVPAFAVGFTRGVGTSP